MTKKKSSSKLLTEEQKIRAFTAASPKVYEKFGLNPDLSEANIRFGSQSKLSDEQQHMMAKVKGLQIGLQMGMNLLLPDIRTQEDLDNALRMFDEAKEQGPTVARKVMDKIRSELPRGGGPGRSPKLDAQQSAKVCDQISQFMRSEKLTLKQALAKTAEGCPDLVGKKVGARTLQKIWGKRDEFPSG